MPKRKTTKTSAISNRGARGPEPVKWECLHCGKLLSTRNELRHLQGVGSQMVTAQVLAERPWVMALLQTKKVSRQPAKTTLLNGGPSRSPRRQRTRSRNSTPVPMDSIDHELAFGVDDSTDPPATAENQKSAADILSTTCRSTCIAAKVTHTFQRRWETGPHNLTRDEEESNETEDTDAADDEQLEDMSDGEEDNNEEDQSRTGVGEEGVSLWDLLGEGFLRRAAELGVYRCLLRTSKFT